MGRGAVHRRKKNICNEEGDKLGHLLLATITLVICIYSIGAIEYMDTVVFSTSDMVDTFY